MDDSESDVGNFVMYISKSHIEQLFTELVFEADKMQYSVSESGGSGIKLGFDLLAKLDFWFSDEVTREEIHEINFNDKYKQLKMVLNNLEEADHIYPISSLWESQDSSPTGIYHFDTSLELLPYENEFGEKYIEVIGSHHSHIFKGTTSAQNWSSRSHLEQAIKHSFPFPFSGGIKPITVEYDEEWNEEVLIVKYIYIIAPNIEESKEWYGVHKLHNLCHNNASDDD